MYEIFRTGCEMLLLYGLSVFMFFDKTGQGSCKKADGQFFHFCHHPAQTCVMKVNDSAYAVIKSMFQKHGHKEKEKGFLMVNIVQTADNYSILNSYLKH